MKRCASCGRDAGHPGDECCRECFGTRWIIPDATASDAFAEKMESARARLQVSLDPWLSVAQPCPLCGVTVAMHHDQQLHIAWHLRNLQ